MSMMKMNQQKLEEARDKEDEVKLCSCNWKMDKEQKNALLYYCVNAQFTYPMGSKTMHCLAEDR